MQDVDTKFKPLLTGCRGNGKRLYLRVLALEGHGGQQILRKRTHMRLNETSHRRHFKKKCKLTGFYMRRGHTRRDLALSYKNLERNETNIGFERDVIGKAIAGGKYKDGGSGRRNDDVVSK